jgi:FtsH-binding integral membrane protein
MSTMRSVWAVAVLTLVFVSEVVALVAFGMWGWDHSPRWVLVWLLPAVGAAVWGTFASPKARLGGPWVRPVVKVVVLVLAYLALRDAWSAGWALAFVIFAVVVNGLALFPVVRDSELATGTRPPVEH